MTDPFTDYVRTVPLYGMQDDTRYESPNTKYNSPLLFIPSLPDWFLAPLRVVKEKGFMI